MGALISLLPMLLGTVSKFIPDPQAQAQAQIEMTKVITEQQNAVYAEMSKVMAADAASESALTRNQRPIVALGFASIIGITFLLSVVDAFLGTGSAQVVIAALKAIPPEPWNAVMVLVGGYTLVRSAEKITGNLKR